MYQILFSDLDATLLNDQKEIEPGTKAAISKLLERGAFFAVCTGRPLASARAVAKQFGLDQKGCYLAAYNGGVLYDPAKDQVVSYASIPIPVVRRMFALAERAGLYIHTYDRRNDTVLTYRNAPELEYYTKHTKLAPRVGMDVLETLCGEPAKLIVAGLSCHERLVRFQEEQAGWADEHLNSFFSCEEYLEYCPAGISKGAAVKALCGYLGIPAEASVAAGDERNDLAMLTAAGIGAAPRNAHPAAKEAADYLCEKDHNEGAVGEIIERFFL
ncbi:MAG: Cof-type HAD-IIB family hydrolase [Eubacterium sp.]|nr:Cof-type HAD-IIB family hydrolase [Eubacterium sp.]